MEGHYCVNKKEEIITLLTKHIPMKKHPLLKQFYLAAGCDNSAQRSNNKYDVPDFLKK